MGSGWWYLVAPLPPPEFGVSEKRTHRQINNPSLSPPWIWKPSYGSGIDQSSTNALDKRPFKINLDTFLSVYRGKKVHIVKYYTKSRYVSVHYITFNAFKEAENRWRPEHKWENDFESLLLLGSFNNYVDKKRGWGVSRKSTGTSDKEQIVCKIVFSWEGL